VLAEFAQAGKGDVTVADLLSHRAGLAWVDGTLSYEEALSLDPVVEALEQAPSWEPGTAHGYHATTYGWLVGEVVRRVSGRSLGSYLRDEIAGPLDAEFFVGLPSTEEHRVARLVSFLESLESGRTMPSLDDLVPARSDETRRRPRRTWHPTGR
jgi:CubicO group peptidase (beta-lactamase class C family)